MHTGGASLSHLGSFASLWNRPRTNAGISNASCSRVRFDVCLRQDVSNELFLQSYGRQMYL